MPTMDDDVDEVLISQQALQDRIHQLGQQISSDYAGQDLLLVCVLKGAILFLSDLMREITIPHSVDFMAISSYGNATVSSGVVAILKDLERDITGRHILIVEDKDSLRTMLRKTLESRGYAVEEAADAYEARRRLSAFRYLVVLTDLKLPAGSGMDVLHAAREADPETPAAGRTAAGTDPSTGACSGSKTDTSALAGMAIAIFLLPYFSATSIVYLKPCRRR